MKSKSLTFVGILSLLLSVQIDVNAQETAQFEHIKFHTRSPDATDDCLYFENKNTSDPEYYGIAVLQVGSCDEESALFGLDLSNQYSYYENGRVNGSLSWGCLDQDSRNYSDIIVIPCDGSFSSFDQSSYGFEIERLTENTGYLRLPKDNSCVAAFEPTLVTLQSECWEEYSLLHFEYVNPL